jgi:hypothetical protein
MDMEKQKINHLAVWAVVVLGQVVPALWYGLNAEYWMALNGLTADFIEQNQSMTPYMTSIFSSIAFAYTLAWVFSRMKIRTGSDGLMAGFIMGLAFTHLPGLVQNMFSFRPSALSWVDGGANLLVWIVGGLILGAWTNKE